MAVSYALRGLQKVSPELTKRIRETAASLGYAPDPMLSALIAYRKEASAITKACPLAWLSDSPEDGQWRTHRNFILSYYEAACGRASELGYHIEYFWLKEPGMTPSRMSKILYSRGITGLLVAPRPQARGHLNLEWERFSTVTFGYSLARPRFHMTTTHFSALTVQLMRKLSSLGYRRPGMFMNPFHDERMDHNYVAPFLFEQQRLEKKDRIPPLLHASLEMLPEWIGKYRPDCIVTDNEDVGDWLSEKGFKIPEEIGVGHLQSNSVERSGMDHNFPAVGVAAVDLLIGQLQRNERGVPSVRRCLLIEGTWHPGKTLRRMNLPKTIV